ncbi:MAG: energy transducer TonB [Acidobacteria bacterium]|nr:energy transducer TonB [Acidobacteriota bacterium]
MFETAVVKTREVAAERRFGLLSASIAAHTFVGLAVVVGSLSATTFPNEAPKQFALFKIETVPQVPVQKGDPNGGAKQPVKTPVQLPQQKPAQQTAPTVTPDAIPTPQPPTSATTDTNPGTFASSGEGDGTGTVVGPVGDPNGIDGGLPVKPEVVTPPTPNQVFRAVGEVKPAKVLVRVSPNYPPVAAKAGVNGVVVVECIIGSDGTIREPRVVRSSFAAFDQPALDAVNQWRFAPGTLHGTAVDTYFELTITFIVRK